MGVPKIDKEKCDACGDCVEECPAEAIKIIEGVAVIDPDECTECTACVDVCPNEAIEEVD